MFYKEVLFSLGQRCKTNKIKFEGKRISFIQKDIFQQSEPQWKVFTRADDTALKVEGHKIIE